MAIPAPIPTAGFPAVIPASIPTAVATLLMIAQRCESRTGSLDASFFSALGILDKSLNFTLPCVEHESGLRAAPSLTRRELLVLQCRAYVPAHEMILPPVLREAQGGLP